MKRSTSILMAVGIVASSLFAFHVASASGDNVDTSCWDQYNRRGTTLVSTLAPMGLSTDDCTPGIGCWYGYRSSKAALNQMIRTLAIECRVKHPDACILAIHPGTTDTALSRPFQRNVKPGRLYTAQQTAARILRVIRTAGPAQSGSFLNWDGREIPW